MAGISSLGVGSGLDLSSLVDNLIAAERAPVENSINREQNKITTQLSGIGVFRGAISSFRSSLSGLENASNYATRTYSNAKSSQLGVSITNQSAVGSYEIDIANLAKAHSVSSTAFSSLDDTVGEGTIQIKFGTITGPGFTSFTQDTSVSTQTITLDSTNNKLSDVRDLINNGDYGVTAAIINDGTGYRLTLTSNKTGENAAMEISITDTGDGNDTDASGLSRLAYNASATQMTELQAGLDANLTINNISITSATNTLTEAIEGTTLNLLDVSDGAPFNLTISEDNSSVTESINKVVDAYNTMVKSLNDLSKPGIDGAVAGPLASDTSLRNFESRIRTLLTSSVAGLSGSITALSNVGITTNTDGTLSVDSTKLNSAIEDNPEDALALFAKVGKTTDSNISFNTFTDDSVAGNYDINITQMATQSVLTGATGLSLPITIDANNDNLSFYIDGVSTGSIALTQGSYSTGADLAAEIQSKINTVTAIKDAGLSVTVAYDTVNNGFTITSNQYGSSSQIEITSVDNNTTADLGFSVGAAAAGVDVAGTIGGYTADGEGQTLTANVGKANGLSIEVTGGTTGARGSLRFSRGLVEEMNTVLSSFLNGDGILASKEDSLNKSLEDLQKRQSDLEIRIESLQARYIQQFSALDALVANFQTTGNFLAQQINSLPGFTRNRNNN